jgi:transglutaminase-like putative cysteine protease
MEKSQPQPRWWDWHAVILLFILLQTIALRLSATRWTPHLYLIQIFTLMGFAVGMASGYSRFTKGTARWISFCYMLLMLPLQWTLVIDNQVSLEEKLASVGGRLLFSISELLSRRPVEDPLFFVAIMSITFWIIGASAGFHLLRRQNFLAIALPSAIGILVIQNYDNAATGRLYFLAFFIFIALFLLGRLNFLKDQKKWREKRVFVSPENGLDLTSGMAIAAGLIILAAWTVPISISRIDSARQAWSRITKPWRDFTDRMENAVSALESRTGGKPSEFYGSELELGRGFPLSESVVFVAEIPDLQANQRPPRYYWRGRTYDHFANGQWYTTGTTREEYSPLNAAQPIADIAERVPSRFTFNIGESNISLLYAPSQPIWFSRPGSLLSSPAGEQKNIITWNATPSLLPGETYQVDAVLNDPNITELRESGVEYPEWITNPYLQLPEDFSPRIKALAEEITATAETPYDKAEAITLYLRGNITYADTVPEPPRNADVLEWILFEHKQGYCVYYATTEILMLRSLGIPARMAVGFAQGEGVTAEDVTGEALDFAITKYTVRRKNAHAWPEVYFPGIGWVEFEPTSNQAPLDRPVAPQDSTEDFTASPQLPQEDQAGFVPPEAPQGEEPVQTAQTGETLLPLLYLIPILIASAALTIFLNRRYAFAGRVPSVMRTAIERTGIEAPPWLLNWERWMALSPIEKSFESINFGLHHLEEQPIPVHATPIERADKLSLILPHIDEEIKVLLDEHQTSLYTSREADEKQARRAASRIRAQIILAIVRHFFTGAYLPNKSPS